VERVTCDVCPRNCTLAEDAWGFCDVRAAHKGSVQDMYYSAIAWPGVRSRFGGDTSWGFSVMRKKRVAEVYLPGCNLKCSFCVAPFLSKIGEIRGIRWIEPAELVRASVGLVDVVGVSGGEPSIHVEYLVDVFSECRDRGIRTSFETNGCMTKSTAQKLAKYADCVGLGLKASLDASFYKQKFGVETQPIREAAKVFVESGCEVILTNLTDPNLWNDTQAFKDLATWISHDLGPETRLALSSLETKERAYVSSLQHRETHLEEYTKIATDAGLQQVFFQVDMGRTATEHREHLEKIGLYRTLQKMGIRPSDDRW
jgi:pyruvate formate lyase activating enzyme